MYLYKNIGSYTFWVVHGVARFTFFQNLEVFGEVLVRKALYVRTLKSLSYIFPPENASYMLPKTRATI